MPDEQREYWKEIVTARLLQEPGVKDLSGTIVSYDFVGDNTKNPAISKDHVRIMVGDPKTRKSLYPIEIRPEEFAKSGGKDGIVISPAKKYISSHRFWVSHP